MIDIEIHGWRRNRAYRYADGPLHPLLQRDRPDRSACVLSLQWKHLRVFGRPEHLAGQTVAINGVPMDGTLEPDTRKQWRAEGRHNLKLTETQVRTVEQLGRQSPKPRTYEEPPVAYDPDKHILLGQIAHRALLTPEERPRFYGRVKNELPDHYMRVQVPDWPPVPYAPLALIMQIGDGEGEAPWWEECFWTGEQPAIPERKFHEWENWEEGRRDYSMNAHGHASAIARQMAGSEFAPKRLAYMWQVAEFDPAKHVIIRSWLEEHGGDIAEWWLNFWPLNKVEGAIVEVANPMAAKEVEETGQWSPTRRALSKEYEHLLTGFMEGRQPQPAPPPPPRPPMPVMVREDDHGQERPLAAGLAAGVKIYEAHEVADALESFCGRRPRFFSGRPMDQAIVAMTRENVEKFLREDHTDRARYIRDSGGRNNDCDDFGLRLRTQLQWTTGINGLGVIAGDSHAWCFFVVADGDTPRILMYEPQTDEEITSSFDGDYSIDRRLEVLL